MWFKKKIQPEYTEILPDFKHLDALSLATQKAYNHSSFKFAETRRGKKTWEQELSDLFSLLPKKKLEILDLGCGAGRVAQYILEHAISLKQYIGIDFSQEILNEGTSWVQETYPRASVRFIPGLLQDFNVSDGKYDLITLLASYHHLTTREDRESCIELCYRALKPGGRIWMTNWNALNLQHYKKNTIQRVGQDFIIPFTNEKQETYDRYYHGFSIEELTTLLRYGGFEDISHSYVTRGEVVSEPEKGWNIITSAVKQKV